MLIMENLTTLRCRNKLLDLSAPVVAGIINVTPDSYYSPSRIGHSPQEITDFAGKMVSEGASILDIGGMSTRPGASEISSQEETDRIGPVIAQLSSSFPDTIISIDTYRASVAQAALKYGADLVNDISGGSLDESLWDIVKKFNAGYILMHMRGTPATMQNMTDYEDVIYDVVKYFVNKLRLLRAMGIQDIVLDPGFGFAKTPEQNFQLIARLKAFGFLDCPLMIGVSRKSSLSKTIGRDANEALHATTALHMAALLNGASVLRVHDVQPARDTIEVYCKLRQAKNH